MGSALARLQAGGFSIGIEAPLDNDWTPLGEQARRAARRLPGEPDLQRHAELARLADRLGFRALWVRDVPVYDPAFGDAAQVFEVFSYLGYLAGITNDILLGTGAVVLPIREPLLTLKSARSVQRLSGDRLLLGVASGDRPVEYPLFGRDFDSRGSRFREQIALLREGAAAHLPQGLDVLPADGPALPLFVAGLAQQQPAWIGQHMGWLPGLPGRAAGPCATRGGVARRGRQQAVCQLHPPGPGGRCRRPPAALALRPAWRPQRPAGRAARHAGGRCRPHRPAVPPQRTAVGRNLPRNRRVRAAALPGPCRRHRDGLTVTGALP
ncbi:LLM class flavin-dependent oxidoreductase [Stenotrophomonas maltophilia]|uniref:LLM class flavin-dependent oxidoreductase n=1 Tax=Stenotrophomonas maltophilia TaxID=40324 RepID=UPI00215ADE6F|nr:LLM class flavin-dependent oxidoreductase [Stenotrophomonas maltophilia]